MSERIALNQNFINPYYPSPYYENLLKYPSYSLNYENSYNYPSTNDYITKNQSRKQTYDIINKYRITRNSDVISNYNNMYNPNEIKKNKKIEFSKSMDKIIKQNKPGYNNKSIDKINKEILKFKNKMHKDKEYLNFIQSKLITPSANDIKYEKRRAYSLTNRNTYNYNKNYMNIKNVNYEFNDYFTEKRKIKNIIINNNNFVDNNIIYNKNLINYKEDSLTNKKIGNKDNNYIKRNNSYLSTNNNIVNRLILNKNINKNDYIEEDKENYSKENESQIKNNINGYGYIKYPERKSVTQKQNDYSNMKFLTINPKNDKIQLKEKEIKLNDISNLAKPQHESLKNKKALNKYQTEKFDKYVNNIINENNKESNDKSIKITLNTNEFLTNYENIKKKYDKDKININELSTYYRKRSGTCIKEDKKEPNNNKMNHNNIDLNNGKISNTLDSINSKYFENIDLNKIKNKYSSSIKNDKMKYNETLNKDEINKFVIQKNNNFNSISAFSLNIENKEENNKDLLINNLNQKIKDLEKQLINANSKIKNLSEIIEEMKAKDINNKILIMDKNISFNYIPNKNNYIKINNQNNNRIKIKIHKINLDKINNNKSKSSSKYINNTSENENYSYSSFDNYKNMNLFFRKITPTLVNDKKINRSKIAKSSISLTKNSIKNNINTLPNKIKEINNKDNKDILNTNSISNNSKDIPITEKTIYTLYKMASDYNLKIIVFDPDSKKFSIQEIPDNHNFLDNYKKNHKNSIKREEEINNSEVFLFNDGGYLYIITGENYNMFYKLDINKREIIKLCDLKYNHSNGNMIYYDQRIFCLSGDNTKKVECYLEPKDEWIEIPEMIIERSNFSTCIIREQYLFALFGYNNINKQYLNSIEFIDLLCENAQWKYLYYENVNNSSLFLTGSLSINMDDKKIITFGGYDGNEKIYNKYFYQINLKKNFDEENYDISDEKLSEIIRIEKCNNYNNLDSGNNQDLNGNKMKIDFCFNMGYNRYYGENENLIYISFDKELNAHMINAESFSHEIFNFQ